MATKKTKPSKAKSSAKKRAASSGRKAAEPSARAAAPTKKSLAKKRSMEKADAYRKRMSKNRIDDAEFMKPVVKKPLPNRVPPRIIKKVQAAPAKQDKEPEFVDNAAAVDLAARIALAMKKKETVQQREDVSQGIRLTRRPTTRDKGKTTATFPKKDLEEFRKKLIAARENALNGMNGLKATGFNESDDREADGGDGTNQTLRLQALGQMGSVNRTISKIEEALHRIDDGTYGVCTMCGQLIRKPRLLNQPFVLTCMECQSDYEKSQGR